MAKTVLHVINHTHWDREWFVPFTFTKLWIPPLIKRLEEAVKKNPEYKFLFDGQTLILDDLNSVDPSAYDSACRMIENGNLQVGPYYAQIDSRISSGEILVRNLVIGTQMAREHHATEDFTAWCVDLFGHSSQVPQIHRQFGIQNAYLWRGVAKLEPFFRWQGADGSELFVIDLFPGGYRNFYQVTKKADMPLKRLLHEVTKLRPYYPAGHIPVFDGYDLDQEPGDAASYFEANHSRFLRAHNIDVKQSSPYEFAESIRPEADKFSLLESEQISGKAASVFPGTLSSRIYAKLQADFTERLLTRYAEPLSAYGDKDSYPVKTLEQQSKLILQNLVHDVICGCSIDQVHEIAELRSQEVTQSLQQVISEALQNQSKHLPSGLYAYIPTTSEHGQQILIDNLLYKVHGTGVGIIPVDKPKELTQIQRKTKKFAWKNTHYSAELSSDGRVRFTDSGDDLVNAEWGRLMLRKENGDTYWEEPAGEAFDLEIKDSLCVKFETDDFAQVSFTTEFKNTEFHVHARVDVTFDTSARIKWKVELDSEGVGYSLVMRHDYGRPVKQLYAGMPFDTAERNFEDNNLYGAKLEDGLASVLIGQRDVDKTFTFPFHNFVSAAGQKGARVHLLARGLRAYQTEAPGKVDLVLQRSVDWLMKTDEHKYHDGDAGPKFYVPDARGQRRTVLDCAMLVTRRSVREPDFFRGVDAFLNTPLFFKVTNDALKKQPPEPNIFWDESIPLASIHQLGRKRLARVYNPTNHALALKRSYLSVSPDGRKELERINELPAKKIATLLIEDSISKTTETRISKFKLHPPKVTMLNFPLYPTGPDSTLPESSNLRKLKTMQAELDAEESKLKASVEEAGNEAPHSLVRQYYVVARENMEARLSIKWNKQRAARGQRITPEYAHHVDPELFELAAVYNDLRSLRRMYDYIVDIDPAPLAWYLNFAVKRITYILNRSPRK